MVLKIQLKRKMMTMIEVGLRNQTNHHYHHNFNNYHIYNLIHRHNHHNTRDMYNNDTVCTNIYSTPRSRNFHNNRNNTNRKSSTRRNPPQPPQDQTSTTAALHPAPEQPQHQ